MNEQPTPLHLYRVTVTEPDGSEDGKDFYLADDDAAVRYARSWSCTAEAGAEVRLVRLDEVEVATFVVEDA